jgi:hypothetical protein
MRPAAPEWMYVARRAELRADSPDVYEPSAFESRPRPAAWRLALVTFAQFVVAIAVVTALARFASPVTAALVALALAHAVAHLWPSHPALAARHWAFVLAETLAIVPSIRYVASDDTAVALVVAFLGVVATFALERRALAMLANVYDPQFLTRIELWLLRVVPACATFAALGFALRAWATFWPAVVLALTAFTAALPRVKVRFEQLTRVELREAIAPLVVLLLVTLGALAAAYARTGFVWPFAGNEAQWRQPLRPVRQPKP